MYSNDLALWHGIWYHLSVESYIHMAHLRRKTFKQIALPASLYFAFFVFLFATDPNKLPIGWLLLPFVLLFGAIFLTILYVQRLKRQKPSNSSTKGFATAAILAAIPTFLLLLDSINQLTLRDALIFIVFAIVALFYVRRMSFARST